MKMKNLHLIVAIAKDGAIGKDGDLIWKISEDLKRFKALTTGHTVIMGRKTWDSLPKKPLPNRRNIILTRRKDFHAEGAETVNSIEQAIKLLGEEEAYVIGGAEVYKEFLPYITELNLTQVNDTCPGADSYLNLDLNEEWEKTDETPIMNSSGVDFRYVTYKRKPGK